MKKAKKGFTLIEMLVVVLVIGTLAAIAVPQYKKAVLRSRAAEVWSLLPTLRSAAEEYCLANGGGQPTLEDLSVKIPLSTKTPYFEISSCSAFLSQKGSVAGMLPLTSKSFSDIMANPSMEDYVGLLLYQSGARTCIGDPTNCYILGFTKGEQYCHSGHCQSSGEYTE